jgi:hypothetical protein
MSKRDQTKTARPLGVECYKLRVVVEGAIIHALSTTEPAVLRGPSGELVGLDWTPILGTDHGDTLGFVRWADVSAVSWRRAHIQ